MKSCSVGFVSDLFYNGCLVVLSIECKLTFATLLYIQELLPEGFTPAPRVTEADTNGNVRTLNRRLATRVYLAVKQDDKWTFPTVNVRDEETLLDATKRAVADVAGEKMELYCPSNCPMGVDMIVHSDEDQKKHGTFGTKTFFLRVQHDEGDVSEESGRDYGWLDRDEMTERVKETEGEYASKFYHYLL
jgi:large subunit ribosomal protein L46